jgi:hypothetical protein
MGMTLKTFRYLNRDFERIGYIVKGYECSFAFKFVETIKSLCLLPRKSTNRAMPFWPPVFGGIT